VSSGQTGGNHSRARRDRLASGGWKTRLRLLKSSMALHLTANGYAEGLTGSQASGTVPSETKTTSLEHCGTFRKCTGMTKNRWNWLFFH